MYETVSFSQGDFHAVIFLSELPGAPLKNVRKIFSIILLDSWENEQAVKDMESYLENIVPDSKKAWDDASTRFQHEWRLIEKPTQRRTRAEISETAAIRAHNNELTRAVKKAKAQHEHWIKILTLWNDTKRQMNIK